MQLEGFWWVFVAGCFGGFLAELLKWYRMRESEIFPEYAKRARYWVITALLILAGGVLAAVYGSLNVNAVMAVNIGASAPLIIESLSKGALPAERIRGVERARPSVRRFLAGE